MRGFISPLSLPGGRRILINVLCSALLAGMANTACARGSALLSWNAPSKTRVGSSFSLRLSLASEEALQSLSLSIGYDPQALEVMRVAPGDVIQSGKPQAFNSKTAPPGQIVLEAQQLAATGSLATITFRANKETPSAPLQILSVRARNAAGEEVMVAVPGVVPMLVNP